jgi:hypothetical protein
MSNGAWQKKPDRSDFTSHHVLYKEAVVSKMWIFRQDSKTWYTPDEFREEFILKKHDNIHTILGHFKIMDPQVGLKQRLDLMKRTSEEIESFTKRVAAYYSKLQVKR